MTEADWLKLALLCLAGAASPGLSWLLILSMSASKGTRVGISGALGHGTKKKKQKHKIAQTYSKIIPN